MKVLGSDSATSEVTSGGGGGPEGAPDESASEEEPPETDEQEFRVDSGFTSAVDSIGTRYTSAGALVTNPNMGLAAYEAQVLFNLIGKSGDVLDSTSETVAYIGPGESVPVAPLQIGFDLKQEPVKLEVQVVGSFNEDDGPRSSLGGESIILDFKGGKIAKSDYFNELDAQVTNPSDEVVTDASWNCVFISGKKIVGGASSAIIDPIPPGATIQFGGPISVDNLSAKTVKCRVVTGY